ncbi:TPA: hypothetical protein ACH3X1_005386 [Trebouxia sp. C0004]
MADAPSGSEAEPIVVESASVGQKRKSAGHRQNDDIWQYYSQIPLPQDRAKALHRNYDACCKLCGKTVVGQQKMKDHTSNCSEAPIDSQHTYKRLAEAPKPTASESSSLSKSDAPIAKYVDKGKISSSQLFAWRKMLCIAFIMAGWSFHSVENPYFIKFMGNVRPNFELLSCQQAKLQQS